MLPGRLPGVGAARLARDPVVQRGLFGEEVRQKQSAVGRAVGAIRGPFGRGPSGAAATSASPTGKHGTAVGPPKTETRAAHQPVSLFSIPGARSVRYLAGRGAFRGAPVVAWGRKERTSGAAAGLVGPPPRIAWPVHFRGLSRRKVSPSRRERRRRPLPADSARCGLPRRRSARSTPVPPAVSYGGVRAAGGTARRRQRRLATAIPPRLEPGPARRPGGLRTWPGTAAPYSWGTGRSTGLLACTVASVVGTGLARDASRKRPHLTTFWKQVVGFSKSKPDAGGT
jgi:hypothetical protein